MPDAPLPGGKYEFAEHHDDDFAHLARYMRIAATFLFVLGALSAVGGVMLLAAGGGRWFGGVQGLVAGVLYVTMGGFVFQSSTGFRMIVDTRGRDVKHLMGAVRQLATAFLVLSVGFCVHLILVGIGLAVQSPN